MSGFPESPTAQVGFGIYTYEEGVKDFIPVYYPERFNSTSEKEFEKTGANCEGQRVSIDEVKNSTIHITGKYHESDAIALKDLYETFQPVEVVTPAIAGGSMESYVKSVERGDYYSFDRFEGERLFEYTIDLVSTGKDEYHSASSSRYGSGSGPDSGESGETSNIPSDSEIDVPSVKMNGGVEISVNDYISKIRDQGRLDNTAIQNTITEAAEKTLEKGDLGPKQIRYLRHITNERFK